LSTASVGLAAILPACVRSRGRPDSALPDRSRLHRMPTHHAPSESIPREGRPEFIVARCSGPGWYRRTDFWHPQLHRCIRGRTDGSIRLRATFFKNRLHLVGRPQMSTGPKSGAALLLRETRITLRFIRATLARDSDWPGLVRYPNSILSTEWRSPGSKYFSAHFPVVDRNQPAFSAACTFEAIFLPLGPVELRSRKSK
jgi:hypothetical protein